jgi:hypothetical protein
VSGGDGTASQVEQRDRERAEIEALLQSLALAWEWLDAPQSIAPYWLQLGADEYPSEVRRWVLNPQTHSTQELSTGRNRWHQWKFLVKQWHQPNLEALRDLVARTRAALLELAEAVGIPEAEATWPRAREEASALWERRGLRRGESGAQCRQREVGFLSGPRRVERELQVLGQMRAEFGGAVPAERDEPHVEQSPTSDERTRGARTKRDRSWRKAMRLSDSDMAQHPGKSRELSLNDLAEAGDIDPRWASRQHRMLEYYEQWWRDVRSEELPPAP